MGQHWLGTSTAGTGITVVGALDSWTVNTCQVRALKCSLPDPHQRKSRDPRGSVEDNQEYRNIAAPSPYRPYSYCQQYCGRSNLEMEKTGKIWCVHFLLCAWRGRWTLRYHGVKLWAGWLQRDSYMSRISAKWDTLPRWDLAENCLTSSVSRAASK
jgi:hypothetical protein